MSFSAKNAPPYEAAGSRIDAGVRDGILTWFSKYDVEPSEIWTRLREEEGFGSDWEETAHLLDERFGQGAGWDFAERNEKAHSGGVIGIVPDEARPSLLGIPDPLFLDAVEYAVEQVGRLPSGEFEIGGYAIAAREYIDRLFKKRGIQFHFGDEGPLEWHGDPTTYDLVLKPALMILADPRVSGGRREFEAALTDLRRGTEQDRRDAVMNAGRAVESMMKVLLDTHGVPRPPKENARPLWDELRKAGIVAENSDFAVVAAPHLANKYGRHGVGEPAALPTGVPEVAVHVAASAITYLAGLLP